MRSENISEIATIIRSWDATCRAITLLIYATFICLKPIFTPRAKTAAVSFPYCCECPLWLSYNGWYCA